MAKKYNKKLLILALVALIGFGAGSAILSYFSAKADEADQAPSNIPTNTKIKTNIDYIIDYSNNGDDPDTANFKDDDYYIVEIGSGSQSSLGGFSTGDENNPSGFNKLVVTGNKTAEIQPDDMRNGSVNYSFYTMENFGTDSYRNEALEKIASADLLYISLDAAKMLNSNYDITDDVRIAFENFAITSFKPIIVDSPRKTNADIDISDGLASLVTEFRNIGASKGTFEWDMTSVPTVSGFFGRQGNSKYVQIRGKSDNWYPVYATDKSSDADGNELGYAELTNVDTGYPKYMTKVLTLTGDASDTTMTTALLSGMSTTSVNIAADGATINNVEDSNYVSDITSVSNVYEVKNTDDFYNAYYLYGFIPEYIQNDVIVYNTNGLNGVDLDQYDIIVFEGTMNGKMLGNDYNALSGAMYANKQIIYSSNILGINNNNHEFTTGAVNFDIFYSKIATKNDKARYNNILLSSRKKMNVYTSATIPSTEKDIVNIINNGRFRGIGSSGTDATNKFTVLEIQPAYPIDTDLAAQLEKYTALAGASKANMLVGASNKYQSGFYYVKTDSVLNDTTSDEISLDGTDSLTEMKKTGALATFINNDDESDPNSPVASSNYYEWELSRAKVLHLINQIPEFKDYTYDMVKVVHMSTLEFNCSKDTLTDNYDIIYFGGNNSAIKQEAYFQANPNGTGWVKYQPANFYRMYYHNADVAKFNNKYYSEANGNVAIQTGNDISLLKKKALEDYIKAGMLIIFSKDVCEGFETANSQGYNQHVIDPDSNVYSLLEECTYGALGTTYADNIVTYFDDEDTIEIENPFETYGSTYSGYVTVFGPGKAGERDYQGNALPGDTNTYANENDVLAKAVNSVKRPKYTVSSAPKPYDEYDESTFVSGNQLVFKFDMISSGSYKAYVYYDDNGNSRFEEDTEIVTSPDGIPVHDGTNTVTAPVADGYHEAIYWKLEIRQANGKASASTAGICKIKKQTDTKSIVDVLQIMPESFGKQGHNTLMFCTECQRFMELFEGNISMLDAQWYDISTHKSLENPIVWDGHNFKSIQYPTAVVNKIKAYDSTYDYKGSYLGVHEHKFGIVKYGTDPSCVEYDDWSSNWADELLDEYDFNLNILSVTDYNKLIEDINKEYSTYTTLDEKLDHRDKLLSGYEAGDQKIEGAADFRNYYLCMHYIMKGQLAVSVDAGTGKLVCTDTKGLVTDEDFSKFSNKLSLMGIAPADVVTYSTSKTRIDAVIDNEVVPQAANLMDTGRELSNLQTFINDVNAMKKYDTYYNLYSLVNQSQDGNYRGSALNSYRPIFQEWRDGKIIESYFKDKWTDLQFKCALDDNGDIDFSNMYSTIVIGSAGMFGGLDNGIADPDISVNGCNALVNYNENGGKIFLLHDTINGRDKFPNMNTIIRPIAGQDARHLTVDYISNSQTHGTNEITVKAGNTSMGYDLDWSTKDLYVDVTAGSITKKDGSIKLYVGTVATWSVLKYKDFSINPNHTHYNVTVNYQYDGTIDNIVVNPADDDVTENSAHVIKLTFKLYAGGWGNPVAEQASGKCGNVDYVGITDDVNTTGSITGYTAVKSGKDTEIPNYTMGPASISFTPGGSKFTASDFTKQNIIVNSSVPVTVTSKMAGNENIVLNTGIDTTGNQTFAVNNYYVPATAGQTPVFDVKDSYLKWHDGEGYTSNDKAAALEKYYISRISPSGEVNYKVEPTALTYKAYGNHPDNDGEKNTFMTAYSIYYGNDCEDVPVTDKQFNHWDHISGGHSMTDKATQNNRGLVTTYPFGIAETLQLAGTHSQTYALDVEDENMTVWYSLAGGAPGTISSSLAADPGDGQNNYYIYTYNNVTYCGIGHLNVTGWTARNNDERRLMINVIINNARKSAIGTRVNLYDPDATQDSIGDPDVNNNKKIIDNGDGSYKLEVSDELAMPEFSFIATADTKSGSQIKQVQIYYDLDLDNGMEPHTYTTDDANHVLVYDTGNLLAQGVDFSGVLKYATYGEKNSYFKTTTGNPVTTSTPASELQLKLKPGYIRTHSDGEDYTYLVVKVTTFKDGQETTVYRKIKIVPKPFLFDLT